MKSNAMRTLLASAVLTAIAAIGSAQAADIIPVITDPANFGYNETTPVAPVGGNVGTTRGEQRRIVAQYAASLWGSVLKSDVVIEEDQARDPTIYTVRRKYLCVT